MKLKNITTAILLFAAIGLMAQDNIAKEKLSPEQQKLISQKQELTVQRGKVSSALDITNKELRAKKGDLLRNDKDLISIQKKIQSLNAKIDKVIEKKYPDVATLQNKQKDLTEQFVELCSQQKDVIIEMKKIEKINK
jgi:transposase-like protein